VERQNEMMTTLMKAMSIKPVDDPLPRMERRSVDKEGNQFALGDSEDEDKQTGNWNS
jgi:hypothetical protein